MEFQTKQNKKALKNNLQAINNKKAWKIFIMT